MIAELFSRRFALFRNRSLPTFDGDGGPGCDPENIFQTIVSLYWYFEILF